MFKYYRKKILRHPYILKVSSWLLAKYMRFVFNTNRWTFINRDVIEHYWNTSSPLIACFWHNRLGMMTFSWESPTPFHMLISGHPDGRIIAKGIEHLGINTIAGSTNKGATDAIRQLLRVLKEGHAVGITPDGPRGPRFSVNTGLINIAKHAKVDILPASYATTRRIVLSSWDRLIIPLPFGKGVFICGEPIKTTDITAEEAADNLRMQLLSISTKVDHLCGHPTIPCPSQDEQQRPYNALSNL